MAQDLRLARNTVRKLDCSDATERRYDRDHAQSYPKQEGFIGEPREYPLDIRKEG